MTAAALKLSPMPSSVATAFVGLGSPDDALALLARFAPDHVDRATLPDVLAAVVPPVLGRGEPVGEIRLAAPVRDLVGDVLPAFEARA